MLATLVTPLIVPTANWQEWWLAFVEVGRHKETAIKATYTILKALA